MAQFRTRSARLIRSIQLSRLTKHLEFEVQGVARFGFVPGQWLSVRATTSQGEEITRAYSVVSAPSEGKEFAFCLNRVQGGFMSNYLCDLQQGAEISFQGPFGDFILRPPLTDTVLIATGTGVAPFRSMLLALFNQSAEHGPVRETTELPVVARAQHFWLLFGARFEQDIYYREDFKRIAAAQSNFHFMPTLSRGGPEWRGLRGYVQEHLREVVGGRRDMQAYICGLDKMVSVNRDLLGTLGWSRESIRYENYD
ncbi:MAG TPA: FAD-dependent oxidoreductase [Candidatus Sulfotelmatobacter sp.]|nr:FAD-dependent oxidoreductase [Candidatus Sulfotelmatobacter sp.]